MPINRNKLKVKVTIKWLVNVKVYGIKPNPFKEMINKKVIIRFLESQAADFALE